MENNIVAAGYDAVFAEPGNSPTLRDLWRRHASGLDFPDGFDHISFVTISQLRVMAEELRLAPGRVLVDVGCGMAGPALWVARETGAGLIGVDLSSVAVAQANARAGRLGLQDRARFTNGSFAQTGLTAASADGVMSEDALQYAPDKRAAFSEFARILRPGGRLVFAAFELEPERVAGLPVLGDDPVADYRPLMQEAGFTVDACDEVPGWLDALTAAYAAVLEAGNALTAEMGAAATAALLGEITLTLQIRPYRRRVLAIATRN
ncbi:MAG: class I SAM-dependent methyltransferase [Chloroflexi bacterium]|nr:class I SAM-dependent methyltransferase [Chloroflexota bacterium]